LSGDLLKVSKIWVCRRNCCRKGAFRIWSYIEEFIHSFIHSGYFYSASSSSQPLLLRGAPDTARCCIGVSRRSATDNCEWRTCPRSLRGGWSGIL